MANYFVDSTTGNDADDGTTMDLAFATLKYAVVSGGLGAGDYLWVRRIHAETVTSLTNVVGAATGIAPITVSGWPRAADATADQATWTNGSTTVDLVTTLSLDREQHLGRFITAPDGEIYMITLITDSNTFTIDREYVGPTVTLTGGAFTIQADEDWEDDMGTAYGFDDSGWTIKEAAWDADADDLPLISHNTGNTYFYINQDHNWIWANLDHTDFSATGFLRVGTTATHVRGCLCHVITNTSSIYIDNCDLLLERCVFTGDGIGGTSQRGIYITAGGFLNARFVAVYGFNDTGIHWATGGGGFLEHVNVGVEAANGDNDIYIGGSVQVHGRDVKLGAGFGEILFFDKTFGGIVSFENFNHVLGAQYTLVPPGLIVETGVVAGSGDPYKRSSGSDSVVEVLFNGTGAGIKNKYSNPPQNQLLFTHEFEATTDSRRYRYYVQSEKAVLASELWIEVEYVSVYEDTTEYHIEKVNSDEAITIRGGASDWSQYIEVEDIKPAVGSTVRIKCYCSFYDATDKIYIDPLCEVTT